MASSCSVKSRFDRGDEPYLCPQRYPLWMQYQISEGECDYKKTNERVESMFEDITRHLTPNYIQ